MVQAAQASAQPVAENGDTVADTLEKARQALSAVPPRQICASSADEIVVCARTDSSRYRVPSTAETDPASRAARMLRDGNHPSAPDMEPHYPGVSVASGCFIPPCPKPPVYYIDLKALPEAPEGSDASQVASGQQAAR